MKIKVLMLPKCYPNYLDPTEGNYVERHIKAISHLSAVAVLYVHSDDNPGERYNVQFSQEHNFPVVRVFFKRSVFGWSALDKTINLLRYLKAQNIGYRVMMREFGTPSLTHVHMLTRTCIFALYLKWAKGIRFVVSEHWSGFLKERRAYNGVLRKRIGRWLSEQADFITCVSESIMIGMQSYGFKNNFVVIPNVVDTDIFQMKNINSKKERIKIIHVSRLDTHPKNLPAILRAVKNLTAKRTDFELHLIGSGVESGRQITYAEKLGILNNYVFFHGYKSYQEVADFLRQSSFLVMFSNYESQSCVILEAFSCGIPVIASKVGGIPEIVNSERGILIKKGDEEKLTEVINQMLDTHQNYNPLSLRSYALNNFSISIIGSQFIKIYLRVLNS